MATELRIFAVPGIPEVTPGADIGKLIANAIEHRGDAVEHGDVFVIAQKIVSKAEGALIALDDITPSRLATAWAATHGKDPRIIQVVLDESRRIVRMDRGIIISETRHGFVCANSGVDSSNVPPGFVTVLPSDPDESAERVRHTLIEIFDQAVATIISDTFGRPWREGIINVALGVAGLRPLVDHRGCADRYGRRLEATVIAIADELASAAELVMGKTAGLPVAVIRGAAEWAGSGSGKVLVREAGHDLFR